MRLSDFKKKYGAKLVGVGINTLGIIAPTKAAKVALDIFRSPKKGRIQSSEKKFLKKFTLKSLMVDNLSVATYDNNKTGKKVLLCHGWESNSSRWRKLYRELQKTDLNVIMIDAPAHGASGSDKFDGKIYASFINTAVEYYLPDYIVGHSVGAYSVIYAMYKYKPSCVNKLVIMASPDKLSDICFRYFKIIGLSGRLKSKYFKVMEELFEFPAESFNASDFVGAIEVPSLIIHDKEDEINLFPESQSIYNSWPNSELVATSGLGHSLQHESVYDTIRDYLL